MNRAQRRANNRRVIKNRLKELKQVDKAYYNYICQRKNKLNKQDAFDCGDPDCVACTLEKNYSTVDNRGRKRRDNNYRDDLEYET